MHNLEQNTETKALFSATRRTDNETGTSVDLKGEGRKLLVMLNVGATSTVTMALTIQESTDDSTFTTLQAVTPADYVLDGNYVVDLTPTKRYIRAIVTMATTAVSGTYIDFGVAAIIYNLRNYPENI